MIALGATIVSGGSVLVAAATVSAHTEASAVAVPAGSTATVAFQPEHGCGQSPTVTVRVQAPVAGAQAGSVEGWTATATPDGAGNTVLEWTGGSLPADVAGAFPVEFSVPDLVGSLLAFPAVQRCADGAELAWIGTAPGDPYPAPQVLVLAPGSEPAATLDDVPADAPGRELLVALAEGAAPDDSIAVPATTAAAVVVAPPTAAPTTAAPDTAVPATAAPTAAPTTVPASSAPATTAAAPTTLAEDGDEDGSAGVAVLAIVLALAAVGAAGWVMYRRREQRD